MIGAMAIAALLAGSTPPPPAAPPQHRLQPHVAVKTAAYEFESDYPARAVAIPALAAFFETERARIRAEFVKDAADGAREAKQDGRSFNPYDLMLDWKIVTETPRFLSFSGSNWSYSGGAHGNGGTDSLVWDKAARARIKPIDIFVSAAALWSAIRAPYCRALDADRAERRSAPVKKSDDPFDRCPQLKDLTLLLGSTNRKAIDRIGLIADQYVAGSYAEGPYEITLPVTAAVIAAVKPGYRAAFATRQP